MSTQYHYQTLSTEEEGMFYMHNNKQYTRHVSKSMLELCKDLWYFAVVMQNGGANKGN